MITFPTYGRDQIPSLITVDLALRTVVLFTDSDEEKKSRLCVIVLLQTGYDALMTQRTKVEQDFLNDIDGVAGFHLREDGKIERDVYEEPEPGIVKVPGEYYDLVEIVSEDDFLLYVRDEIEERRSLGEFVQK